MSLKGFSGFIVPVLAVAAIAGGSWWYQASHAPCVSPIGYHIGAFDGRFGVSRAQFTEAMREAAAVWNTAAGKTVFQYDENGSLPVNLVYDTREATTQQNQTIEGSIDSGKQVADSVKQEYTSLKDAYASDSAAYASAVQSYETELDAYNSEVDYWNGRGGAPKSEYQRLSAEKSDLDAARTALETKRTALNAEADRINALIDEYNLVAQKVNTNIAAVNQTAGREFEEGEYVSDSSGTRINIYEFQDTQKLVRVLAHEFGHALGLPHNDNADSIMYYLNKSANLTPTADDIASLKALCAGAGTK